MNKKILITTCILILLILTGIGYTLYNKYQATKIFNLKQQTLEAVIQENNKDKNFDRYEPYVGPNNGEAPTEVNREDENKSIINKL